MNISDKQKWKWIFLGLVLTSSVLAYFIKPPEDIPSYLSNLESILKIIGGFAIILAVSNYTLNRKKLDFSVMQSCINRYSEKFSGKIDDQSPKKLLKKYVDFVNEEMFYIENDYIPEAVKKEWVDGMIDFLPLYDKYGGQLLNENNCIRSMHSYNLFSSFTRVKTACTVNYFKEDEIYSGDRNIRNKKRSKLIKEIIKNLEGYKY